mmetsp:Transcript_5949/g.9614  ORF Transcript_5949/g.9614 Transcript_5949/m.9614 type:complete len:205 (-) Transcript_5949:351-965(-)
MNIPPLPKWFNTEVSKASKLLLEQALDIYDPHVEGHCRANYRKSDSSQHPIEVKFADQDIHMIMKDAYSKILNKTFLPEIGRSVPDIDEDVTSWLSGRKEQWKLIRKAKTASPGAQSSTQKSFDDQTSQQAHQSSSDNQEEQEPAKRQKVADAQDSSAMNIDEVPDPTNIPDEGNTDQQYSEQYQEHQNASDQNWMSGTEPVSL